MAKRRSKKLSHEEEIEIIESMNHKKPDTSFRIKSKFKNQKQKELYDKIMNNRVVFVAGAAGTGKTYVTLMAALQCLKDGSVNEILITKPIVEASRSMGFLPGDMKEKMSPYMFSFWANLSKIVGKAYSEVLKSGGFVKEVPLNYVRGNTFGSEDSEGNPKGSICILDEAQNCTEMDMKLYLSRMGEGSKLIVMGDIDQSDLKLGRYEKTGLEDAFDILQGIPQIDFMMFTEDDIVRDATMKEIMKRYKEKSQRKKDVE